MPAFKYELRRISDQVVTHVKVLDQDVQNPWSRIPSGWNLEGDFEIIKTDITAQVDAEETQKSDDQIEINNFKQQLDAGLSAVQAAATVDDLKPVLRGILRYIRSKER